MTPQSTWGPAALNEWGSEQVWRAWTSHPCVAWMGHRVQVLKPGTQQQLPGLVQAMPLLSASVSLSAWWE